MISGNSPLDVYWDTLDDVRSRALVMAARTPSGFRPVDISELGSTITVSGVTITGIVDNEQLTRIATSGTGTISGTNQLIIDEFGRVYAYVGVSGDVSIANGAVVGISGVPQVSGQVSVLDGAVVGVSGTIATSEVAGGTGGISGVAATSSSQTLLGANAARLGMYIYNSGTERMFVKFGATAGSGAMQFTLPIYPEDAYEMPRKYYTGRVDVIWEGAPAGSGYATEIV